jgi:hypothetical protein
VEVEDAKLVIVRHTSFRRWLSKLRQKVVKARNSVLEFLLINHPLVARSVVKRRMQAPEYAYKYSIGASHFKRIRFTNQNV